MEHWREILRGNNFKNGFLSMNDVSCRLKALSKAPQAIVDTANGVFRVLPFVGFITNRSEVSSSSYDHPKFVRCKSFDEVHECHREPGIIKGYRNDNCSVLQALLSVFHQTNETINFWTHFIPALYFLWIFFSMNHLFSDNYFLPFFCYLITSCAYPLMSSLAHAFSCLSVTATHVCYFVDYATLSLYSWGAAILYYNYIFPKIMFDTFYSRVFLSVAAVTAINTTFMACFSRVVAGKSYPAKFLRLLAFVIPYLWVSTPLIWRLLHCNSFEDSCIHSGPFHIRQFIFVLLAALFYGSHIPERFAPGRFDFIGHSHNFLHVFSSVATYEQLQGAFIDMEGRRSELEDAQWSSSRWWVTTVTPMIFILNVIIITFFTRRIVDKEKEENAELKAKSK